MGQEYFINDQKLQNKVAELLPSQGGAGAGFDLSASTQIIPIVDLTESAEGSNVRQDLQTALSFAKITNQVVSNTTSTIINNTGYFTITGFCNIQTSTTAVRFVSFILNDGSTDKGLFTAGTQATTSVNTLIVPINTTIFLPAGHSCIVTATAGTSFEGSSRQIADVNGVLNEI